MRSGWRREKRTASWMGSCAGFRMSFSIWAASSPPRRISATRGGIAWARARLRGSKGSSTRARRSLARSTRSSFPAGGRVGGYLHQCRTVCRRAEREILRLSRVEEIGEWPLKYVNRLSDLFFVLARWVGKRAGEKEYLWQRGLQSKRKQK